MYQYYNQPTYALNYCPCCGANLYQYRRTYPYQVDVFNSLQDSFGKWSMAMNNPVNQAYGQENKPANDNVDADGYKVGGTD